MGQRDKRFDTYITESPEFARPILTHIRDVVHSACPGVEEGFKWSHPHFMYQGILCGMASFKEHVGFGFWKASLIMDARTNTTASDAMGQFGRLTSVKQLPSKKVLTDYIKQAMKLNAAGIKVTRMKPAATKKGPSVKQKVPPDLSAALERNRQALDTFNAFNPSARKEYIEWITEARTEQTRNRRLEQAVEWMAEGKQRHWKHQK